MPLRPFGPRPLLICTLLALAPASALAAAPGDLLSSFRKQAPAIYDHFGYSLAGRDGQLLVGAPFDDQGATDTGVAYLYDAPSPALRLTFLNPTPEFGDYYAKSVALLDDRVLIGSSGEDRGRAYIRDLHSGDVLFILEGLEAGSYFGHSVAATDSLALVGAFKEDAGGSNSGAAYVFDVDNGAMLHRLVNPTPAAEDYFAAAVAASGQHLLLGAMGDDVGDQASGAAHLFDAASGGLQYSLTNPSPDFADLFGAAVAMEGNNLVIGAPGDDLDGLDAGIAYLFNTETGQLRQTLRSPRPTRRGAFGSAVAVQGDFVLVGAPGGTQPGSAYLFDAASWQPLLTFRSPSTAGLDEFGATLGFLDNNVLIGAPDDSSAGVSKAGAVYLFRGVPEPSTWMLAVVATAFGPAMRRPARREGERRAPRGGRAVVHGRSAGG